MYVHFLAAAVVDATEDVDAVIVVLRTVQEPRKRHTCQLDKLQGLEIEDHGVLRPSAVVMTTQDHYFIVANECGCLRLDAERELDHEHGPLIVGHIVLLDTVDPP